MRAATRQMSDRGWTRRFEDELRDPLAFGIAEATAFLAFAVGSDVGIAVLAGLSVMVVRVIAGMQRPTAPARIPEPADLTSAEQRTAKLIGRGFSDDDIAEERGATVEQVQADVAALIVKLHYATRADIGAWARWAWPSEYGTHTYLFENPTVRMILMAGSFIGLGWTSYQIVIQLIAPWLCRSFSVFCAS